MHPSDVTAMLLPDWRAHLTQLSVDELYAAGDALSATVRHPVNSRRLAWRMAAEARLALVTAEKNARWQAVAKKI